ncbi:YcfA-like protein [Ceratobasidium sp. AG-Ba]|nr:YcfA-like protein [Ceratobasidium sp. AG-Ba]
MMETPISAKDARQWRKAQSENVNQQFSGVIKSSHGASSHVAGIASLVVPLTKTKTPATLEKIWDAINKTYVDRAGMDIDILWGLEDSMNPEPQWSAWAITRTKEHDDDTTEGKNARALVRKGPRSQNPEAIERRRQRRLAIANEPTTDEFEDLPILMSESEEDSEEEEEDSDGWTDYDSDDEDEIAAMERQFEQMMREESEAKALPSTGPAAAKSPERSDGNVFKRMFRSLRGRFLSKDPVLSVDPQPPVEFDERDEDDDHEGAPGKKKKKKKPKKKAAGAGDDDMPGLVPIYPYKGYAPDLPPLIPVSVAAERLKAKQASAAKEPKVEVKKNNVMLEEVEDADTHKAEGSGKKKKKKKKKAKKAGEPEPAEEDEEDEAPAPKTPVMSAGTASAATKSPPATKSPQAPKPASAGGASASTSTLYTPQPETARSGLSYMKSEGISVKTKAKSRPEGGAFSKIGDFMSRTFGRRQEEEVQEEEPKKRSGMAERLKSFMKSVSHKNMLSSWERILGIDDAKGQAGLEWNEFVKAMVNLGFSYDESSAGSRVRFDPPNKKDKSYTTHKPHPDPWLNPKRVKDIARDLNKMYGFDKDMLHESPKGSAIKRTLVSSLTTTNGSTRKMQNNRSLTTEGRGRPQLASNANINIGRKHSLPAQSFGPQSGGPNECDLGHTSREPDSFQADDPGAVATLETCWINGDRAGKSLRGTTSPWGSKLEPGTRSSASPARAALITDARQPQGRSQSSSATPPALIDTRQPSYRDIAVKCTPPPSPLATPSQSLPAVAAPALPKTQTNAPSWPPPSMSRERPKLDTGVNQFPPLMASPAPKSATTPAPGSSTRSTYAKCFESSAPSRAHPISESPVSTSPSTAKVITLNITPSRPPAQSRRPSEPTTPSKARRKKSSASPPATLNALRPSDQRTRSASVSSISSTPSLTSTAPTSVAVTVHPWESEDWYAELVVFARQMSTKNRRSWEKILRCDPKDRSKMKWTEFDSALKNLGFESRTRGGSDLEYAPSLFGENAQPISYHRPHPGQEFSLGDLKAKACSFRARYPGAVAALHEAWNLVDTRN